MEEKKLERYAIERTIPSDISGKLPENEYKRDIYKGKHVCITYYPDRVIHPKYYLQILRDKILFPFHMLRLKYEKTSLLQENEKLKKMLEQEKSTLLKTQQYVSGLELSATCFVELLKSIKNEDTVCLKAFHMTHPKFREAAIYILSSNGFQQVGAPEHEWYAKNPIDMNVPYSIRESMSEEETILTPKSLQSRSTKVNATKNEE